MCHQMCGQMTLRPEPGSTGLAEELSNVQMDESDVFVDLGLLCVAFRAHIAVVIGRVVDSFV